MGGTVNKYETYFVFVDKEAERDYSNMKLISYFGGDLMQQLQRGPTARQYKAYLFHVHRACGWGIFMAVLFSSQGQYVSWPASAGWQREIALWNVGILAALALALVNTIWHT